MYIKKYMKKIYEMYEKIKSTKKNFFFLTKSIFIS